MKKILLVFMSLVLISGISPAQDQQRDRDRDKDRDRVQLRDHVLLKDGILYQLQDQTQSRLQTQLKLHDGTIINPDGSYQMRNGKTKQLRDGECMDMSGKRYKTQERLLQKMEVRERNLTRAEQRTSNKAARQQRQGGRTD